jgi:hypothetical protein
LQLRVRQQELLAEYGVLALKGTPFPQLLHDAAAVVAAGLKALIGGGFGSSIGRGGS